MYSTPPSDAASRYSGGPPAAPPPPAAPHQDTRPVGAAAKGAGAPHTPPPAPAALCNPPPPAPAFRAAGAEAPRSFMCQAEPARQSNRATPPPAVAAASVWGADGRHATSSTATSLGPAEAPPPTADVPPHRVTRSERAPGSAAPS
eukprot:scaffold11321_cov141-Isochrysis_galbana.AAC.2